MKRDEKENPLNDAESMKKAVRARAEKEKRELEAAGKINDRPGGDNGDQAYYMRNGYLCRTKYGRNGEPIEIRLCNFSASIAEENYLDDGREVNCFFAIDGKLHGKQPLSRLEVPATNFAGMSWVCRWGCKPTLEAGQTVKDSVRHAIQTESKNVAVRTFYAHTGWRSINGNMVYLHPAGAIGGNGDISVKLPTGLDRYSLPSIESMEEKKKDGSLARALETSLSFLSIGKNAVTIPLFCLVYLAPLTTILSFMPNFVSYLFGASGTFKTTVSMLALSHFGSFTGVESLSNFDDSIASLERRAFILKDTLNLIDDYHPSAHKAAAQTRENIVQRIIRGYSNRTARGRLNPDATEKGRYEPRGMALLTAEELPMLESTLARTNVLEVKHGDIDRGRLTILQEQSNLLPYAMTAYIYWLKDNMDAIKKSFPQRFSELRQMAFHEAIHKKLPEQSAFQRFALEAAVSFFHDQGVLSDSQGMEIIKEGWETIGKLAERQDRRISEDDPVALWRDIIHAMVLQKNARIENRENADVYTGGGDCIGYYDSDYLYLIPQAAWHAALTYCSKEQTHFPFSKNTFYKMLKDRRIILPATDGRKETVIKVTGRSMRVLKIADRGLYESVIPDRLSDI